MENHEFKNFFCLLIAAGNDTTRYSLAMAIYEIANNPSLLKNLKSDFHFRRLLGQKKIHTNYFSVYFGKNLMKQSDNKLNISFIMKKKSG